MPPTSLHTPSPDPDANTDACRPPPGILVCYLFYLRGRFDEIHTRIRNSDGGQLLTAADFTLMVSDIPLGWGSDQVRQPQP